MCVEMNELYLHTYMHTWWASMHSTYTEWAWNSNFGPHLPECSNENSDRPRPLAGAASRKGERRSRLYLARASGSSRVSDGSGGGAGLQPIGWASGRGGGGRGRGVGAARAAARRGRAKRSHGGELPLRAGEPAGEGEPLIILIIILPLGPQSWKGFHHPRSAVADGTGNPLWGRGMMGLRRQQGGGPGTGEEAGPFQTRKGIPPGMTSAGVTSRPGKKGRQ